MSAISSRRAPVRISPSWDETQLSRQIPPALHNVAYGFLLRIVVGLFAVFISGALVSIIALSNGSRLTTSMLILYASLIVFMVTLGEHLRSQAFERTRDEAYTDDYNRSILNLEKKSLDTTNNVIGSGSYYLYSGLKRSIDILFSIVALALLFPAFVVIACAVRFDTQGPVVFRQRRLGLGGSIFVIYKFRTMVVIEDDNSIRQAVRGDYRVTRVGALLRRTSLDELPQLWNVLKGDMSLVGPRPQPIVYRTIFKEEFIKYAVRFSVKPGLTGLAEVSGLRGSVGRSIIDRFKKDVWYVRNRSMILDLYILRDTVFYTIRQMLFI